MHEPKSIKRDLQNVTDGHVPEPSPNLGAGCMNPDPLRAGA